MKLVIPFNHNSAIVDHGMTAVGREQMDEDRLKTLICSFYGFMVVTYNFVFHSPTGVGPTHSETELNEGNFAGDDTVDFLGHRRSLSEAKLAALCTEVWPVLALIGGVDSGLRAGGLCMHKPSGRRALLLGVLKEGSSLAKLQWEEADLSVRYYKYILILPRMYDMTHRRICFF